MSYRADICPGISGGEQIQGIQFRYGERGKQIQHIKKAGFVGLYPFEFTADFTCNFGTDGGSAFIGGFHAGDDFLVGGIFEHIVTYTQLKCGKNQFIVFINRKDYDSDIRQGGEDFPGGADSCIFCFHFNIHEYDIRRGSQGGGDSLCPAAYAANECNLRAPAQIIRIFFPDWLQVLCNEDFYFIFHLFSSFR